MYKGGTQGRYIRFTSRVLQRPGDADRLKTNQNAASSR
jgi:hypothetical protein